MITTKSSDLYQSGFWRQAGIQWRYVDVTDSARALSQAHLSGPTAALILAESLVAVALLKGELTEPEEALTLRLKVDGPVEGVMVECDHSGALRGYTHIKVLNQFDGLDEIVAAPALGENGTLGVIRSLPGRLISQATLAVVPPTLNVALDNYLSFSLQRMAFAAIQVFAYEGGIDQARGLLVELLPDGEAALFEQLRQVAADGMLAEALEHAQDARALCDELSLGETQYDEPQPLRFACRCSRQRALEALMALPLDEMEEMIRTGESSEINCHMCGEHYNFTRDELQHLLRARQHSGSREDI